MFWKKRSLMAALCMVLCFAAFPVPQAMAAAPANEGANALMPRMTYIYEAYHNFVISNGTAWIYATVRGDSGKVTKCEVSVELQEKRGSSWDTVDTWYTAVNGRSAEIDESHAVTNGKTYRMVATVTAWCGNNSETRTMTSEEYTA